MSCYPHHKRCSLSFLASYKDKKKRNKIMLLLEAKLSIEDRELFNWVSGPPIKVTPSPH